jgi:hypothetical protein
LLGLAEAFWFGVVEKSRSEVMHSKTDRKEATGNME